MSQTECEIAFVSKHVVINNSSDTLNLSVDHKNQESFPTDGPEFYVLPPGSKTEVSSLEWAGEFRDPTGWYTMSFNKPVSESELNNPKRWKFKRTSETEGVYYFIIE